MRFLDVLTLMVSLYTVSDSFILSFVIMFLITPFVYAEEIIKESFKKSLEEREAFFKKIEKEMLKKLKEDTTSKKEEEPKKEEQESKN